MDRSEYKAKNSKMQDDNQTSEYLAFDSQKPDQSVGLMAKIKAFLTGRYFGPLLIVLVALTAFSLGRLSVLRGHHEPVRVLKMPVQTSAQGEVKGASIETKGSSIASGEAVVASKNGSKYHLPSCAGAKQISEKNKITFASAEAARAAGYTPASNCPGLK